MKKKVTLDIRNLATCIFQEICNNSSEGASNSIFFTFILNLGSISRQGSLNYRLFFKLPCSLVMFFALSVMDCRW